MKRHEGSCSDVAHATCQCTQCMEDPKVEHASAVKWLVQHLGGACNKGATFAPDKSLGLEVFVNANFTGNWGKNEADTDQDAQDMATLFSTMDVLRCGNHSHNRRLH